MKKAYVIICLCWAMLFVGHEAAAQCSICTRTAAQMGEKPARGLNAGILYLAVIPIALVSFISYQWWKRNQYSDTEATAKDVEAKA